MSALAAGIRAALAHYLAGEISLVDFDRWFTPSTWDIERQADPEAEALADEIDLRLAEYTSGHWTEPELRQKLRDLQPDWIDVRQAVLNSNSDLISLPMVYQAPLRADLVDLREPLSDTRLVTAPW